MIEADSENTTKGLRAIPHSPPGSDTETCSSSEEGQPIPALPFPELNPSQEGSWLQAHSIPSKKIRTSYALDRRVTEELRPGPRADERANSSSSDEEEQVLEEEEEQQQQEEAGPSTPQVRHAERNAGCDDINQLANVPAKRRRGGYSIDTRCLSAEMDTFMKDLRAHWTRPINLERRATPISKSTFDKTSERILCMYSPIHQSRH